MSHKTAILAIVIGIIVMIWQLKAIQAPDSATERSALLQNNSCDHNSRQHIAGAPVPDTAAPQLPPIPQTSEEIAFLSILKDYIEAQSSGNISTVPALISKAAEVLSHEKLPGTYVYKYAIRAMIDDAKAANYRLADNILVKDSSYSCDLPSWKFKDYEEAVYDLLFVKPEPYGKQWSLKALMAIRSRDLELMQALHDEKGFEEYPQWPLEVFRQLFTYASESSGELQMQQMLAISDRSIEGTHWAEIGYGSGKIFSSLIKALGTEALITGTEIDCTCLHFAKSIQKFEPQLGWQKIKIVPCARNVCSLPPNSIDFIHPGGLHIGDGDDETVKEFWLPWLESAKNALKKDGLLLIDDGGSPSLEKVRLVMNQAGFREVKVLQGEVGPGSDAPPSFCASYRPIK